MSIKEKEWVLPASIPFPELKGKDLEECLYWLLDAMGAKDLEWRTGGSGGGAADGGRDLEVNFYKPTADLEMEPQIWWVECKGRSGTVEADEVKRSIINAQAKNNLDYVVVATNTQFSNPTRDWVKEWQQKNPTPKIKLWDGSHLERLLSRHPDVVLRLFSEILSVDGQLQALETRFWNKIEFVQDSILSKLWENRSELEFTVMGIIALVANEFANGDITHRPWGAILEIETLSEVLNVGFANFPYLMVRATRAGIDDTPITRALSYLLLCALKVFRSESVAENAVEALAGREQGKLPEGVQTSLLGLIANQLLSEIQDICSADCERLSTINRPAFTEFKDEIDGYWLRLEAEGRKLPEKPERYYLLENQNAPCKVGFPVGKDKGCPLFEIEPSLENFGELLRLVDRVAAFRHAQEKEKRNAKSGSDE